jgi:hypothetical protein
MVSLEAEGRVVATRRWVRAPEGDRWIDANGARFADGATTPMDFGWVPAREGGVDYAAMSARVRAANDDKRRTP